MRGARTLYKFHPLVMACYELCIDHWLMNHKKNGYRTCSRHKTIQKCPSYPNVHSHIKKKKQLKNCWFFATHTYSLIAMKSIQHQRPIVILLLRISIWPLLLSQLEHILPIGLKIEPYPQHPHCWSNCLVSFYTVNC